MSRCKTRPMNNVCVVTLFNNIIFILNTHSGEHEQTPVYENAGSAVYDHGVWRRDKRLRPGEVEQMCFEAVLVSPPKVGANRAGFEHKDKALNMRTNTFITET